MLPFAALTVPLARVWCARYILLQRQRQAGLPVIVSAKKSSACREGKAMAEKITKPKSLTSKQDVEQALLWLDAKLEKFGEKGISISNRKLFAPKRLVQKLTGFLWARQCTQFEDTHVIVSPFLGELEASTAQDMIVQDIEYAGLVAYADEVVVAAESFYASARENARRCSEAAQVPVEVDEANLAGLSEDDRASVKLHDETVARGRLLTQSASAAAEADEWASLLDRARKLAERVEAGVEAAKSYVKANYQRQGCAHLKWALKSRARKLEPPYMLPGVLGDKDEIEEARQ